VFNEASAVAVKASLPCDSKNASMRNYDIGDVALLQSAEGRSDNGGALISSHVLIEMPLLASVGVMSIRC
jgi:hypothetical protein